MTNGRRKTFDERGKRRRDGYTDGTKRHREGDRLVGGEFRFGYETSVCQILIGFEVIRDEDTRTRSAEEGVPSWSRLLPLLVSWVVVSEASLVTSPFRKTRHGPCTIQRFFSITENKNYGLP